MQESSAGIPSFLDLVEASEAVLGTDMLQAGYPKIEIVFYVHSLAKSAALLAHHSATGIVHQVVLRETTRCFGFLASLYKAIGPALTLVVSYLHYLTCTFLFLFSGYCFPFAIF